MNRAIVLSYGGGVQTTAILVLIAQGRLPKPDIAIMADTGREKSSTWRYLKQYADPIMKNIGLNFEIASHDLARVDLYASTGQLLLPTYTPTGKLPTFCSTEWKRDVVRRHLRQSGYGPDKPIEMWYGMSLDEVHRLRISDRKWIKNHYPLCFDVLLRHHECILEIRKFGLPEPQNSACWMCPNLRNPQWLKLKEKDPQDFERAKKLDRQAREHNRHMGNGDIFLHRDRVPLDKVDFSTDSEPDPLWECADSCMT